MSDNEDNEEGYGSEDDDDGGGEYKQDAEREGAFNICSTILHLLCIYIYLYLFY